MDETEIDLSNLSISEACLWLLASLNTDKFDQYAYTIPFSSYVMTWPKVVPLDSILILQSPYPNNIFPPIAAAMSYSSDLCKKEMKGRELPPTVEVLANDLYINAGMDKQDSINILKNGWALIDKGILMFNEAVFNQYNPGEAYIESIKQCSVIIRLLQETEKYGKRTVNIYAFGESGERVGSNLCSWFKSPVVKLSKRKVTHPAGIARRFDDLSHPDCHMATSSFSKALAKTFSNHVAFMHTMGKKSEQDLRSERLQSTFDSIRQHFPSLEQSLSSFVKLQQELGTMVDDKRYQEVLEKIEKAGDDLASRLRIANSIVHNVQSYGSSVGGNVSRGAPSMRTDKPSEYLLSDHTGRDSSPTNPIPDGNFKLKPKKRNISSPAKSESFSNVSPPPSINSMISEMPTPDASSNSARPKDKGGFVLKGKKNSTPSRQTPRSTSMATVTESVKDSEDDNEKEDIVSPLAKKFSKKIVVPTSKSKSLETKQEDIDVFSDVRLNDAQAKALSSIQAIVEINKPDVNEDEDYREDFENISRDIQNRMADNSITQRFVQAINKDIKEIPGFNINKWMSSTNDTCATFELCKEEFDF